MSQQEVKPFGSWESPITSEYIVKDKVRFGTVHAFNESIYWIEGRPKEKGRQVLVKYSNGVREDIASAPFNVRSRVHEYGGNCFTLCGDTIYFSNFEDNALYSSSPRQPPKRITTDESMRFADPFWNQKTNQLFMVCEQHNNPKEPENFLVSLKLNSEEQPKKIVAGHDFYSSPMPSPDGKYLAWICWNHPNMPWDGTELWIAKIDEQGALIDPELIAGGMEESVLEPKWSEDGMLYFISDKSGWWNIYRYQNEKRDALHPMEADFGVPKWLFGMTRYDFLPEKNQLICIFTEKGFDQLALIDLKTKSFKRIESPFSVISELSATTEGAIFIAGNADMQPAIVKWDLKKNSFDILKKSSEIDVDPAYISKPELIEFPTEGGKTAFALYYPPNNPKFKANPNELPPLLVLSHGGPTAHTNESLDLKIQFWTTRGIAVVDVNYGGSTGFGRAYRERLNKSWGIVDVDDCVNAAMYLTRRGDVDEKKLAIAGGSAGGYTTLAALTFRDCFKAGASYYGVSDLIALAEDTHKFEARYLDKLLGPYPGKKEIYEKRSPILHTQNLSCPIILLQGGEDKIVPPAQSELMHATLKKKGIPTAYLLFEKEQHGFREADNIKRAIEAEYYFYSKVFGFPATSDVQPIKIDNLYTE